MKDNIGETSALVMGIIRVGLGEWWELRHSNEAHLDPEEGKLGKRC